MTLLAVLVAAGAGWWAARATLVPTATSASTSTQRVVSTVSQASVGRSLALNATVTQPFALVASNALAGVVTAVSDDGEFEVGEELFAVAGVSVRAVVGTTPFYRDLAAGLQGEDVRELQDALVTLGYLTGSPSGNFEASTTRAVKAWQKATGTEQTGVVTLGQVVAIPTLPAVLRLDEGVVRGGVMSGGEPAVLARNGVARFALVVSTDQAALIPLDAAVTVTFEDASWPAVIASSTPSDSGTSLALTAPDGSIVCGTDCARLPADESISLRAAIQLVPAVSGPGVPIAAVRTDASGATYVMAPDGTRVPVTVRASGDGIAVLDGIAVDDQVVTVDAAGTGGGPTGRPSPGVGSDG